MSNRLYKVVHDSEHKVARMEPSHYFRMTLPQLAIVELKAHIETLDQELRQCKQAFVDDDLDLLEGLEKMRRLILEIELARQCMAYFRKRYFVTSLGVNKGQQMFCNLQEAS